MNELQVGETYKNLKHICEVLGLKYNKSADSRKATLKQIECNYKLERKGNKYTVLEKYDTPKEKEDKRKNNGGAHNIKYGNLMDKLIFNWLASNNGVKEINVSFSELFVENDELLNIPLLTGEFNKIYEVGYKVIAKKLSIRKDLVDVHITKSRDIIKRCFETALNRLQREGLINWNKNIMILNQVFDKEIADDELENKIKKSEEEAYNDMEISYFHRKIPSINKQFKRKVLDILGDNFILSYWNVYSIEVLDWNRINSINNADEIKKELTNLLTKSIHKSLINYKYDKPHQQRNGLVKQEQNKEKYHPFDNDLNMQNINDLDNKFFVDHNKDYYDFLDEALEGIW